MYEVFAHSETYLSLESLSTRHDIFQVLTQECRTKLMSATDIDRPFDKWEWREMLMETVGTTTFLEAFDQARHMYIMDDCTIGLGPLDLEPGDVCCKFSASSVSHFIRRREDHYIVLGEATQLMVDTALIRIAVVRRLEQRCKLYDKFMSSSVASRNEKLCIAELYREPTAFLAKLDYSGTNMSISKSDASLAAEQVFELW